MIGAASSYLSNAERVIIVWARSPDAPAWNAARNPLRSVRQQNRGAFAGNSYCRIARLTGNYTHLAKVFSWSEPRKFLRAAGSACRVTTAQPSAIT